MWWSLLREPRSSKAQARNTSDTVVRTYKVRNSMEGRNNEVVECPTSPRHTWKAPGLSMYRFRQVLLFVLGKSNTGTWTITATDEIGYIAPSRRLPSVSQMSQRWGRLDISYYCCAIATSADENGVLCNAGQPTVSAMTQRHASFVGRHQA